MSLPSALRAAACALLLSFAAGPGRAVADEPASAPVPHGSGGSSAIDLEAPLVPGGRPALIKGELLSPHGHFRIAYTARSEIAGMSQAEAALTGNTHRSEGTPSAAAVPAEASRIAAAWSTWLFEFISLV